MSGNRRLSTSHPYDGGGSVGKDKDLDIKCRQFFVAKLDRLMSATCSASSSSVPSPVAEYNAGPSDLPAFESFLDDVPANLEEMKFFHDIRAGNTLVVEVRSIDATGLIVKALCTDRGPRRDLESLNLDIFVPMIQLAPDYLSIYSRKQLLRAYIFAVSSDSRTLNLRLEESDEFSCDQKLGPISEDAIPDYFRVGRDLKNPDFDRCLRHSRSYRNPTAEDQLCAQLGLLDKFTSDSGHRFVSFLDSMNRASFASEEFATPMRKVQNHNLAMKSVVKGVERFRAGKNAEAMQHLNKALQVEAENVEALVARGALYANSESYALAVQDLELALKANENHSNGRKYLVATLMAQGKALSDDEQPESSKSVEAPSSSTVDDDLRSRLVDYFVKHNVGTTVAEAEKKLADPTLLEKLKGYYEMYHKGGGDIFGRRLSEGDARKTRPDVSVAVSQVATVQSADRPTIERQPIRPQPYDFHAAPLPSNGSTRTAARRSSDGKNGGGEQQKKTQKDLAKMENFIAQLKKKAK